MQSIRRLLQKPGHCGPATIEMMYSLYGETISQDAVARAIGDVERITERGCSVDELAHAVTTLTPDYVLLGKMHGTIEELRLLTEHYKLPVGVEWRGRFLEPDGHLWEEGHYTLVTHVNMTEGSLEMIDPYAPGINLFSMNSLIPIEVFVRRWWDTNPIEVAGDPPVIEELRDDQLLFVLVPASQADAMRVLHLSPMSLIYTK